MKTLLVVLFGLLSLNVYAADVSSCTASVVEDVTVVEFNCTLPVSSKDGSMIIGDMSTYKIVLSKDANGMITNAQLTRTISSFMSDLVTTEITSLTETNVFHQCYTNPNGVKAVLTVDEMTGKSMYVLTGVNGADSIQVCK